MKAGWPKKGPMMNYWTGEKITAKCGISSFRVHLVKSFTGFGNHTGRGTSNCSNYMDDGRKLVKEKHLVYENELFRMESQLESNWEDTLLQTARRLLYLFLDRYFTGSAVR